MPKWNTRERKISQKRVSKIRHNFGYQDNMTTTKDELSVCVENRSFLYSVCVCVCVCAVNANTVITHKSCLVQLSIIGKTSFLGLLLLGNKLLKHTPKLDLRLESVFELDMNKFSRHFVCFFRKCLCVTSGLFRFNNTASTSLIVQFTVQFDACFQVNNTVCRFNTLRSVDQDDGPHARTIDRSQRQSAALWEDRHG